jgi:hypothetical protein
LTSAARAVIIIAAMILAFRFAAFVLFLAALLLFFALRMLILAFVLFAILVAFFASTILLSVLISQSMLDMPIANDGTASKTFDASIVTIIAAVTATLFFIVATA